MDTGGEVGYGEGLLSVPQGSGSSRSVSQEFVDLFEMFEKLGEGEMSGTGRMLTKSSEQETFPSTFSTLGMGSSKQRARARSKNYCVFSLHM